MGMMRHAGVLKPGERLAIGAQYIVHRLAKASAVGTTHVTWQAVSKVTLPRTLDCFVCRAVVWFMLLQNLVLLIFDVRIIEKISSAILRKLSYLAPESLLLQYVD